MTTICCVSDMHGHLPEIPDCHFLCIAGDILPPQIERDSFRSIGWLQTKFRIWLEDIYNRGIVTVGVAGNHDFVFEKNLCLIPDVLHWAYLQDDFFEFKGLKFWGTPWQLEYGRYAFNAEEFYLETRWDLIPLGTDVLISHSPPYMYGDQVSYMLGDTGVEVKEHVGSPSLLRKIQEVKPKLVVCGHIHCARGIYRMDDTTIINACVTRTTESSYELAYAPVMWQL